MVPVPKRDIPASNPEKPLREMNAAAVETNPYQAQLEKEIELPATDIQGDLLLGFNKAYNLELLLAISGGNTEGSVINQVKGWLRDVVIPNITSANDVLNHRREFRGRFDAYIGPAFMNISFSFAGLQKLLLGTRYELSLNEFDQNSAFVIGAKDRASFLGDSLSNWSFGMDHSNDILINIASDSDEKILMLRTILLENTSAFLQLAHEVSAFRGKKTHDPFYGHEHFGFQDGLSQPEVRGTFFDEDLCLLAKFGVKLKVVGALSLL